MTATTKTKAPQAREHPVAKANFRAGRKYELDLVLDFLRRHTGIGSGTEAAAALERKEHRR